MNLIRREAVFFSLLAACLACWLAFLKFCSEVMEGESHDIDQAIIFFIRDHTVPEQLLGRPWFAEMVRDISGLGGIAVLTLVTLAVVSYLAIRRSWMQSLYVLIAVVTGSLFSNLLKIGFDRPRPDIIPHGSHTILPGFPSGHSLISAIVYLTLGAMVAAAHQGKWMRTYLMLVPVILTLLIGISRIYLGVHWPSDVLAGWLGGAAWASMVWILYKHANRAFWTRLRYGDSADKSERHL
jgi:undecaprenyl-diphosphatase